MLRNLLRVCECNHDRILNLLVIAQPVRDHNPSGTKFVECLELAGFMTLGRLGVGHELVGINNSSSWWLDSLIGSVPEAIDPVGHSGSIGHAPIARE